MLRQRAWVRVGEFGALYVDAHHLRAPCRLAGEYEASVQAGQRATAYAAAPAAVAQEARPAAAPASLEELLKTLPPMPAGWKPGDAIPGLPAPLAGAAPAPPAAAPPAPPPPEDEDAVAPAVPTARPLSAAFDFALNPDMELEFGGSDSDSEDSSDED